MTAAASPQPFGDGRVSRIERFREHHTRCGVAQVGEALDDVFELLRVSPCVVIADETAAAEILEATEGGTSCVAECVGTQSALDLAIDVVRPGGTIDTVGVPNGVDRVDLYRLFRQNVALRAGVAPARRYIEPLLADVLADRLDPSVVFSLDLPLQDVAQAYLAMDRRDAVKVALRP